MQTSVTLAFSDLKRNITMLIHPEMSKKDVKEALEKQPPALITGELASRLKKQRAKLIKLSASIDAEIVLMGAPLPVYVRLMKKLRVVVQRQLSRLVFLSEIAESTKVVAEGDKQLIEQLSELSALTELSQLSELFELAKLNRAVSTAGSAE
jgi:hypothetical protein